MAISRDYVQIVVMGDQFLKDTGNVFRVVNKRPYTDKKGKLPDGVTLTLQVTQDLSDRPPEKSLVYENFDATALPGTHDVDLKKGDFCALEGFRPDVSYYIDFNYILRFDNVKKLVPKGGASSADTPKA